MYQAQRRACLVSYATTCLVHYGGILQVESLVAPQLLRCKGNVLAPTLQFSHHFVHRRGIGTGMMEMGSKARVVGKMRLLALCDFAVLHYPNDIPMRYLYASYFIHAGERVCMDTLCDFVPLCMFNNDVLLGL